ncbi:MAG: ABC transporter permease [Opitutales bacterium]|nr:ABC transporter permease [Opitutales bacterium]
MENGNTSQIAARRARAGFKPAEYLLSAPSFLWLVLFFLIPSLLVFAIAFRTADPSGGISDEWTLQTVANVLQSGYLGVLWRTVWVSCAVTAICLLLGIPVGYWIAQQKPKYRYWLLLVVIIPLWTNFLIRIFAWRVLLHPEGFLRKALLWLGIIPDDFYLLNNVGAVIIVTVYTCLPFAILPIYAAAEKFNFALIEAARDLGATRFYAFRKIFLPWIKRGIFTAILVVLIPALGSYAIPDLVGGVDGEMLGNKIAIKASAYRNLPESAALAAFLSIIITIPVIIFLIKQKRLIRAVISTTRRLEGKK